MLCLNYFPCRSSHAFLYMSGIGCLWVVLVLFLYFALTHVVGLCNRGVCDLCGFLHGCCSMWYDISYLLVVRKKWKNIVFKERNNIHLWGELPLGPLRGVVMLMFVYVRSCWCIVTPSVADAMSVLSSLLLWWDEWAQAACAKEVEWVWTRLVLVGVWSRWLPFLLACQSLSPCPLGSLSYGLIFTIPTSTHLSTTKSWLHFYAWARCVHALAGLSLLGGHVDRSARVNLCSNIKFQSPHHAQFGL